MSTKKYRMCLLMMVLLVIVTGIFVYAYYKEQEKSYKNATLVYQECESGEEIV